MDNTCEACEACRKWLRINTEGVEGYCFDEYNQNTYTHQDDWCENYESNLSILETE